MKKIVVLFLIFLSTLARGDFAQQVNGGGSGGSGTVTNVTLTPGSNVTTSGTCSSTTSINCTLNATATSPGGTSGQIGYNNSGAFGGFTASGDATINTASGAVTVTKTSGTAFGALATVAPGSGVAAALAASANGTGGIGLVNGAITATDCLEWSSSGIVDAGFVCGNTTGAASSTNGDLASFNGTTGKILADSGVVAANVVTGPASATSGHFATFNGTSGKSIQDGGSTVTLSATPNLLGMPGYINAAGTWYANPYETASPAASGTGAALSYYCAPFWIYAPLHIETLAIRVTTLSTGNTSAALAGAIYSDLLTTGNVHRPGTLIDYTGTPFNTGAAGNVQASLNNGNDAIAQGVNWVCIQKFDTVATFYSISNVTRSIPSAIGTTTMANAIGTSTVTSVSTTGSTFNSWANFTSSTTWTENSSSSYGPTMALQIYSVP